jgi:phosphomevalonate kinase
MSTDNHVGERSRAVERAEKLALSGLCEELPGLRDECSKQPEKVRRLLARIEEEAKARRPFLDLLGELLGTPEEARGLSAGLPGAGAGRADEEWFSCPDGACERRSQAIPAGPVPRCVVLGRAMKRR